MDEKKTAVRVSEYDEGLRGDGSYVHTYKLELPNRSVIGRHEANAPCCRFVIESPPILQVLGVELIRDTPHLHLLHASPINQRGPTDFYVVRNDTSLPAVEQSKTLRYCGTFTMCSVFAPAPSSFHVFRSIERFYRGAAIATIPHRGER